MTIPKLSRAPLYQQAYEALIKIILDGTLKPGQRVTETGLSDLLGISSTPVREAMRKLEHDGLLENNGNAYQIISLQPQDIDELYVCRIALESEAIKAAMTRLDKVGISALEHIQNSAEEAASNADLLALIRINTAFHDKILEIAGNRWLEQAIGFVRRPLLLARLQVTFDSHYLPGVLQDHRIILEALREHDLTVAVSALRQHMNADCKRMKDVLSKATKNGQ